jgi:hypothetical protein
MGTNCTAELTPEEIEKQQTLMYALIGSFLGAIVVGGIITAIICVAQKKN